MMVMMMPVMHMMHVMHVGISHAPAAEAAVRAIVTTERAIVPEERAGKQPSNEGQYKNEDDETEHCYSPFAGDPALIRRNKKRGFYHDACRIKVSPVMLSRVIIGSPY